MAVPLIHPTRVRDEAFAGVVFHLEGELVPVLHLELDRMPVYFEHHILLWKHPQVAVGVKSLKGAFKRAFAGLPIFMTEAQGRGHVAFSRDGAGQIVPIWLRPGESIDVREHQFLAATASVDYSFTRVKGIANMLFSGSGFFVDTFTAAQGEGMLWLHGYGNVFEVTLAPGEQIDIEPGGWVYKDPGVRMETQFQRLSTGFFASAGQLVWNRFTGPGRVGIQSMYYHPGGDGADDGGGTTNQSGRGVMGGIIGGIIGDALDR
jgi:uncharacterized protein (AIM24 family)